MADKKVSQQDVVSIDDIESIELAAGEVEPQRNTTGSGPDTVSPDAMSNKVKAGDGSVEDRNRTASPERDKKTVNGPETPVKADGVAQSGVANADKQIAQPTDGQPSSESVKPKDQPDGVQKVSGDQGQRSADESGEQVTTQQIEKQSQPSSEETGKNSGTGKNGASKDDQKTKNGHAKSKGGYWKNRKKGGSKSKKNGSTNKQKDKGTVDHPGFTGVIDEKLILKELSNLTIPATSSIKTVEELVTFLKKGQPYVLEHGLLATNLLVETLATKLSQLRVLPTSGVIVVTPRHDNRYNTLATSDKYHSNFEGMFMSPRIYINGVAMTYRVEHILLSKDISVRKGAFISANFTSEKVTLKGRERRLQVASGNCFSTESMMDFAGAQLTTNLTPIVDKILESKLGDGESNAQNCVTIGEMVVTNARMSNNGRTTVIDVTFAERSPTKSELSDGDLLSLMFPGAGVTGRTYRTGNTMKIMVVNK